MPPPDDVNILRLRCIMHRASCITVHHSTTMMTSTLHHATSHTTMTHTTSLHHSSTMMAATLHHATTSMVSPHLTTVVATSASSMSAESAVMCHCLSS